MFRINIQNVVNQQLVKGPADHGKYTGKFQNALFPRVRSICLNDKEDTLLVGTFGSEIYELKVKSEE